MAGRRGDNDAMRRAGGDIKGEGRKEGANTRDGGEGGDKSNEAHYTRKRAGVGLQDAAVELKYGEVLFFWIVDKIGRSVYKREHLDFDLGFLGSGVFLLIWRTRS